MTAYVALLRGINVGGKNRLPMAELRAALDTSGLENVSTVLQSGNILLRSSEPGGAVAAKVARTITEAFGLQIGVVVRSAAELVAVSERNPFLAAGSTADPATLHVAFLSDLPSGAAVATLEVDRSPPDAFAADGREVYLRYPNGSGRSGLTLAYLERRLGTTGTVRNWRTVLRLVHLCEAAG